MPNRIQKVQVCDATEADSSTKARNKKYIHHSLPDSYRDTNVITLSSQKLLQHESSRVSSQGVTEKI